MLTARAIPSVPYVAALTVLNAALYFAIFVAVRAGRGVYEDFRLGHFQAQGVPLRDWVEVSRCLWVNILGLAGISVGAALVFLSGRLPIPFWFLYAAIIIGLLDVFKRNRLLAVRTDFPTPRFDLSAVPMPDEKQGRKVEFRWQPWSDSGAIPQHFNAVFWIDPEAYQQARALARLSTAKWENYLEYVRDGFTLSVQQIAAHLRRQSEEKEFSVFEEVGNVVCFTRSIPYASDEQTRGVPEYANYPVETLYDKAGDCEDHAILAACLLFYLGHDVGLFFLRFPDMAHAALGYNTKYGSGPFSAVSKDGKTYYYIETVPTKESEQVGEISAAFLDRIEKSEVFPVQ